jgi:hypothetical protein
VARDERPTAGPRKRRVERALIGAVMAAIAFVVDRVVARSLRRSRRAGPERDK